MTWKIEITYSQQNCRHQEFKIKNSHLRSRIPREKSTVPHYKQPLIIDHHPHSVHLTISSLYFSSLLSNSPLFPRNKIADTIA